MVYYRKQNRFGINTPLMLFILVVAGAAALLFTRQSSGQVDRNGCSMVQSPGAVVSILLDQTDALTPKQSAATKQVIHQEIEQAPACAAIRIYSLDASWDGIPEPVLTTTRPPQKQSESASGATDTYLERQFKVFDGKLDAQIDQALSITVSAPTSPILLAAQEITADPIFQQATNRKLLVVSDMLENTDEFPEHLNATVDTKNLSERPYFQELTANLSGTTVSILYLERAGRQGRLQTSNHRAFARTWWTMQNARIGYFIVLPQ